MADVVLWTACGLFAASLVCDLRRRRIPNAIPLALLGLFAGHALADGFGPSGGWRAHLAIGAVLLAIGFALYLGGRFGAGDGKLIAVAGLWAGPVGPAVPAGPPLPDRDRPNRSPGLPSSGKISL